MIDPSSLTAGQRNRLVALARAGKALPWGRSDDALEQKRLVRKYRGPLDGEFADLTNNGLAMAQKLGKGKQP